MLSLLLPTVGAAATKEPQPADREILKMIEFLRQVEMIKQMEMLRDMDHLEESGASSNLPRKTAPKNKPETAK